MSFKKAINGLKEALSGKGVKKPFLASNLP
jgi:hypothetical protein